MQVTVHLDALSTELSGQAIAVAKDLGMELRALHPGSQDPALAATFVLEASDALHAAAAVHRLQAIGARAYIKPIPSMP